MAWSKTKTAIAVGVGVLLVLVTTTIILYHVGKPMRSIRAEWSAISGDSGQWNIENGKIRAHNRHVGHNGDKGLYTQGISRCNIDKCP
jgi:hypothetical protein